MHGGCYQMTGDTVQVIFTKVWPYVGDISLLHVHTVVNILRVS